MPRFARLLSLACGLALTFSPSARANFYVGHDTGTGTNNGRLTLLFSHGDHFHRIGVFGGNEGRIPEASAGGPLSLRVGTGALAGRLVSGTYDVANDPTSEYSNLEMRSIQTLLGFPAGSPEAILANSSGGRYLGSLSGVSLALELVSITTGLNVGTAAGVPLLSAAGDRLALGAAASFTPFTPTFFTDPGVTSGPFAATFRLVDLNGTLGQSGTFRYEFTAQPSAVPEPASLAMAGLGLGAVGLAARRRRRLAPAPSI
ncbi:all3515 family Zur-repressed PEP-CTERM protein [Tundrisphaera sp. TA3]|uniref:all3515 family Zur-repressed PEP-CTERM protein n=1 Tax=Tundrisphaera sp. TA3 TaxID=3435775 RepID=UPI003EBC5D96